jgi:hypothetical protein
VDETDGQLLRYADQVEARGRAIVDAAEAMRAVARNEKPQSLPSSATEQECHTRYLADREAALLIEDEEIRRQALHAVNETYFRCLIEVPLVPVDIVPES